MNIKFTITTYKGTSRTAVFTCNTKEAIDKQVDFYMSDASGNTKSVMFQAYTPPNPSLAQVAEVLSTVNQLNVWYPIQKEDKHELWGGDPNCVHDEVPQSGGGVKCSKCGAWFCF